MRFSYIHSNTAPAENLFFSENNAIEETPTYNFLNEKDNHLGSVITSVGDRRIGVGVGTNSTTSNPTIDHYTANILSTADYYAFGMQMPERTISSGYRIGFGGQEADNEVHNNPNNYTAEYWQYDARLGRRWNIDPIVKPWESSYAAFSNNPIYYNDPNGANAGDWLKKALHKTKEFAKNLFKGKPKMDALPKGKQIGDPEIDMKNGAYWLSTVPSFYTKPSLMDKIGKIGRAIGDYFSDGSNFSFGAGKDLNFFGVKIANREGSGWTDGHSSLHSAGVYADVTIKGDHLKSKEEVRYTSASDEGGTLESKTTIDINSSKSEPQGTASMGLVFKFGPSRTGVLTNTTGTFGFSVEGLVVSYNPISREFKIGVQVSTMPIKLEYSTKEEVGYKILEINK